jgi:hypothetical protein
MIWRSLAVVCTLLFVGNLFALDSDPAAPGYAGRKGVHIYVSKKGDNSDGSSWEKAFHTVQAAASAVPDDKGGHQIIIRPDTYAEHDIVGVHKGAKGAYNVIVGDRDGRYGSGVTGWVVIDSSDPEKGFKALDYWGTLHTTPSDSPAEWDRWIFRNLYTSGAEGHGWDIGSGDTRGHAFTGIMDNCVAIGRFSGIMLAGHVSRPDEPCLFRDCHFRCLDWWGDAGGAYFRSHNPSMPKHHDAIFENCTLVGPDNALQVGYPSFVGYTKLKFVNSRLIVTNFSQPRGMPSTGVISCDLDGQYLHIDFEDTTLMGFKAFGYSTAKITKVQASVKKPFSYTTKGKCRAYVEYEQTVPEGFERLGMWPVEVFEEVLPPRFHNQVPATLVSQPVQLFNGKDLNGWTHFLVKPELEMKDVWRVEDGILICKGEPMGYLKTKKNYTSYRLIVEWRWAPGGKPGNSGVLMRINGEDRALPRSIEAQLQHGAAGDGYGFHGMKIDGDASRRSTNKADFFGELTGVTRMDTNEKPPGEWNVYEITLDGPKLTALVNGKKLNELWGCEVLAGSVGLQSEGGEIHFRRVELTPLD